jgi:phage shock protein A
MHVTINERMLTAQLHKKEQEIKDLKEQVQQYLASLRTMKDNLDEVKHLNKVLVNQISSLSLQLKQCPN